MLGLSNTWLVQLWPPPSVRWNHIYTLSYCRVHLFICSYKLHLRSCFCILFIYNFFFNFMSFVLFWLNLQRLYLQRQLYIYKSVVCGSKAPVYWKEFGLDKRPTSTVHTRAPHEHCFTGAVTSNIISDGNNGHKPVKNCWPLHSVQTMCWENYANWNIALNQLRDVL